MAELILTEEEKATASYLDWDDASLGMLVKKLALCIDDYGGEDTSRVMSACHLLVDHVIEKEQHGVVITLEGVTRQGKSEGDWIVRATRITPGGEPSNVED